MGNKRGQCFKELRNFRSNTQKSRRKALFLKRHRMNEITEPAHHLQFEKKKRKIVPHSDKRKGIFTIKGSMHKNFKKFQRFTFSFT